MVLLDVLTPLDVFGSFGSEALAVLPWLVAGLLAAMGLFLTVLGIGKGLSFFMGILSGDGGGGRHVAGREGSLSSHAAIDGYGQEGLAMMTDGHGFGYDEEGRTKWLTEYITERTMGEDSAGAANGAHIQML